MPTIQQSSRLDRNRLTPKQVATPITAPPQTNAPERNDTSPFFKSSLPPIAASFDLYQRQFWSITTMRKGRIYPVTI